MASLPDIVNLNLQVGQLVMQLLVAAGQLTNRLLKNPAQLPRLIWTCGNVVQA